MSQRLGLDQPGNHNHAFHSSSFFDSLKSCFYRSPCLNQKIPSLVFAQSSGELKTDVVMGDKPFDYKDVGNTNDGPTTPEDVEHEQGRKCHSSGKEAYVRDAHPNYNIGNSKCCNNSNDKFRRKPKGIQINFLALMFSIIFATAIPGAFCLQNIGQFSNLLEAAPSNIQNGVVCFEAVWVAGVAIYCALATFTTWVNKLWIVEKVAAVVVLTCMLVAAVWCGFSSGLSGFVVWSCIFLVHGYLFLLLVILWISIRGSDLAP